MQTHSTLEHPETLRLADAPDGHLVEPPPLPYGEWAIVSEASAVTFSARKFGLLTVRGKLGEVSGALVAAPDAEPSGAGVIELAGLSTGIARRDRHLLSEDYLDAASHPCIDISARRVEITGSIVRATAEMTIRGCTRSVELAGTLAPLGDEALELCLAGAFDRRLFGVAASGPVEWGGFAVGRTIAVEATLTLLRRR